jgi:RsiW-degrading membrane proteinase PrsW (M82 family)
MLPHAAPHRRRAFWLAMLLGLLVLLAWGALAVWLDDPGVTIRLLVFGSLFVPVLFVFFMASEGLTEEPPAIVLVEIFVGVALLGNLVAFLLNSFLPFGLAGAGPVEETVKFLGVVWLLRRRKYVSIMDGILFGAAAGMGFAASENLSYFFSTYSTYGIAAAANALQAGAIHSFAQLQYAFNHAGLSGLLNVFFLRSFLGPWMHGSWTAIIAGVAWREASGGKIRIDLKLIGTALLVMAMHSLWDLSTGVVSDLLFVVILIVDVYFLRGLILAAHRQERGEPIQEDRPTRARRPRYCPHCGGRLSHDAQFCGKCGGLVDAGAVVTAAQAPSEAVVSPS